MRRLKIAVMLLGGVLALATTVYYLRDPQSWVISSSAARQFPSAPSAALDLQEFLSVYWQRPIPLQGTPPSSFSSREASLSPESCGNCHERQYADWKQSLHSQAMGPGPWGQILDMSQTSPAEAVSCMTCHAPLSEQSPRLEGSDGSFVENKSYDPKLQLRGITCAACHVRSHRRFGPPKGEGLSPSYPAGLPDHMGVERTPYFERAEFCRDCHQFDPENSLLVNGKPIQDTFREWQNSAWGKAGAACQNCHMPERRHLWRGIHDKEWVKGAVRVEHEVEKNGSGPKENLRLKLDVISAAVGHKFPTYVTPKVFVRAELLDRSGKGLPRSTQEAIIGWDARFEDGEWKEYFDTRVPPGEKFTKVFEWRIAPEARKIRAWVEVHPDHFYHVHFYPAYLRSGDLSSEGRRLIEKALRDSGKSVYVLYEQIFDF